MTMKHRTILPKVERRIMESFPDGWELNITDGEFISSRAWTSGSVLVIAFRTLSQRLIHASKAEAVFSLSFQHGAGSTCVMALGP